MGPGRTGAGEQEASEVVREMARRFAAGDRDGATALFHARVRVQQPASLPHGGWHHGRDGMEAMGRRFARHWARTIGEPRFVPGGDHDADGADDAGDTVVQVTRQAWTALATGRTATVDVAELITVAGGRVTEIRVFPQDTHLLLATLEDDAGPGGGPP